MPTLRRPAALAAAAVAASLALGIPALAEAGGHHSVAPPPASPTSADQIQNIGQVASAIKAYYGDTVTDTVDPVPDDGKEVALHTYGPDSAYVHEMAGLEADATKYLDRRLRTYHGDAKPAVLFDVDDTLLNTYAYEIYANFGYDPGQNADFVTSPSYDLPEVPGMGELVGHLQDEGYTVFFLTGRPEDQREGTEQDLTARGFPLSSGPVAGEAENPNNLYLKGETAPNVWKSWFTCDTEGDAHCTTIERKSQTRAHIESLGYDIVGNFGDQYSDLTGGYADKTFKLPNPMYYLP